LPYFFPENKSVLTHTLQRCGNCDVSNAALQFVEKLRLRIRASL
jgi:hypothetical protein